MDGMDKQLPVFRVLLILLIDRLGKLLLNKDPFSAPRDVWYAQLADKVREHAGRLTDAISARQLQPVA